MMRNLFMVDTPPPVLLCRTLYSIESFTQSRECR